MSLFMSTAASASAVYAWVPDDPNGCCRGVLKISDAAFAAGEAHWTPGSPLDTNPVERFYFEGRFRAGAFHPAAIAAGGDVELIVNFAATPETSRCCAWDFQLRTEANGLAGRLRVTTQNDDTILSGANGRWRIERAGSDAISSGVICGDDAQTPCVRDTGRWVLISPPRIRKTTLQP